MLYKAIYGLGIAAYGLAIRMASLFNPKAKLFVKGREGLLDRMEAALSSEGKKRVWMHCASLGEFEQGRPVLEKLRQQYPQYAYILTFFSPSGYEVRKNYSGADYVFYLPLDKDGRSTRFLDIVQPSLAIFVKYELWYNLLSHINKRHIPTLLISAIFRKDQGFFKWYGGLQRHMLSCFTHLFVQTEHSKELLKKIGIENVSVGGDTRFDRVIENAAQKEPLILAERFADDHKVIVAGSTWREDEVFLEQLMKLLPGNWRLILVPHEVHEAHIKEIERLFQGNIAKWSAGKVVDERVLLIDTVGLLSQLYRYGCVAWIGGGFGKEGVHNVLEGAVFGVPCMYGPIYQQYVEAVELIDNGGAFSFNSVAAMAEKLTSWEEDDIYINAAVNAKAYVYSHAGATEKILNYIAIENLLTNV